MDEFRDERDERAIYQAEHERFLEQARRAGLLTGLDARRLHTAYLASVKHAQASPASVLPRLILEAEDGVVLDRLEHPERANDRWSLYERIREQTGEQTVGRTAA